MYGNFYQLNIRPGMFFSASLFANAFYCAIMAASSKIANGVICYENQSYLCYLSKKVH